MSEKAAKSRKERLELARSRAILDVANELYMDLFRSGRDYRWKEHDSLVISPDNNLWQWFSRHVGGDVISLVETIKEVDFNQAVDFLNDGDFKTFQRVECREDPFSYYLKPYEQPFREARNYLKHQRKLSDETIDFFLDQGVLAQANAKINGSIEPVLVFKSLTQEGEIIGAQLQGIEANWDKWPERGYAKKIMNNSDGMTGLHVDIGQPNRLIFTESAIDLMSYYELHKDSLQDVRLVSMDGLKESIVGRHLVELEAELSGRPLRWSREELSRGLTTAIDKGYFAEGKHTDMITLAVDNDTGGRNFISSLQEKGVRLRIDIPDLPEGQEKADWNSQLQQEKQTALGAEISPVATIQERLSTEADLVSTIASDGSIIYTKTVSLNEEYHLNLAVHSPDEVDHLSEVKAPWTLEVIKDSQSLGYLAYGEDWGNEFNIEDELLNLDYWLTRNQVANHLYSQEEVNHFLALLTAEKEVESHLEISESKNDQLALFDNLADLTPLEDEEKTTPENSQTDEAELISYGSFIIDDEFLESRYSSVEHDNSIRTAIGQLSNLIGFDNMPTNDQETEWVHTKTVDFEGKQLVLDVYSSSEALVLENGKNSWSIAVLGKKEPLGFLAYGEDWLNEQATLKEKLADLQTWITEGSVKKHLSTQQDYNQFLDALKENVQRTSISYEDYKQETKNFEESVKQKIASGDLSINVDDDVYAYLVFNGLGHSHPLKTVTDERLVALQSSGVLKQLRAITTETVDAYKTKGTPEQDRLYQLLKTNQKDLGLAEVSTRLVGEMAISAYNANLRLAGLSQKGYQASYLSLFSNAIRTVIEYPYMENVGTGDYIVNHVDYALYHYLDNQSGKVTLTRKDLEAIIETASYHTPKIIEEENKKAPENLQETVTSDLEQEKKERMYQRKGSLQPEAEGSTSPVPEIGTFERSVTSRPTVSSQYLKFTIENGFKSRKTRLEQSIDAYHLGKLNRRGHDLQKAAQFYLNELANSTIHYFTADNSLVQVNFFENNFMHLTGLKMIGDSVVPEQVLHDLARGGDLSYDDIRIKNTESPFDKLKVLPDLEAILQTDSFYFDHLQNIPRYQGRFDSLIKSDDSDLMVLFRMTSEDGTVPVSIFKARQTLTNELQEATKNDIIGIYRERGGRVEQIAVNEEYVKDNGVEMLSILQHKQYQEVSNEQVEIPEPGQPEVTAEDFTHVLDAVYNNGAQIGKDNRANIAADLHPAWDKYDEYAKQYDGDFRKIMEVADNDKLLDKTSDFYREWSQDDIYDNHYHVRLQELSAEASLPFNVTEFIDYQTFVKELYQRNQKSQSGDEVSSATVNFAIYAPGGDLVKEEVSYHIGEESKPISQLLGLGYRRLAGYQELAQLDKEALSQLENQMLNQSIAKEANEPMVTNPEQVSATLSHEQVETRSEKELLKQQFKQRVEEILSDSPAQTETPSHPTASHRYSKERSNAIKTSDYGTITPYELSQVALQKIREYTQSPEDLQEYLTFMSRFPRLSPRNVALIQAQWPGANAVATYKQWQAMGDTLGLSEEDVMPTKVTYVNKRTGNTKEVVHQGLSVKVGEKSQITLFRPQMEKMIPVLDSDGHQVKNEKGNPKFKRLSQATPQEKALVKDKQLSVTLFQKRDANGQPLYTTYKVFELSQTTLKPESYPKAMPNRHYNFDIDQVKTYEVLEGLCDYAKSIGVTILSDDAHKLGNIKGRFNANRQEIVINTDNTPGEQIATTIHELAHASLHNPKLQKLSQPLPRHQAELEAEMTSYLVSNHFGLDTGTKAIRYMAKWTKNLTALDDNALADSMKRIHKTVMSMVSHVEQQMKPYQRTRGQEFNMSKDQGKGMKR